MRSVFPFVFGIGILYASGFFLEAVADDPAIRIQLGDSITLPCVNFSELENMNLITASWKHVSTLPEKTIVMYTPLNKFVSEGYGDRVTFDNDTYGLTLNGVTFEDSGTYSCELFSNKGAKQGSHVVSIYASPNVAVRVQPVVLAADESTGDRELAVCTAEEASPPVVMKWIDLNSNEVIVNDTSRAETANADNPSLVDSRLPLTFDVTAAEGNEKPFACVVYNAAGDEIRKSTVVSIANKPKVEIFSEQKSLVVEIGQFQTIDCEASGVPKPKVAWYEGSTKLLEGRGRARLLLSMQSYDDNGKQFQCRAKNSAGKSADYIDVYVQGKPEVVTDIPESNKTGMIDLFEDTEKIPLDCVATGLPQPVITWEFEDNNSTVFNVQPGDAPVEPSATESYSTTSTLILNAKDYASSLKKITCIATNKLGSDFQEWVVNVNKPTPTAGGPAEAGSGLVVGIIVAVVVALILLIVIYLLRRKRTNQSEDLVEKGCCSICVCRKKKSTALERQENDQIKEVCDEEGNKEEKIQLTAAEEKPDLDSDAEAKLQSPVEEEEKDNDDDPEASKSAEDLKGKKSRRLKMPRLPSECCKKSKKQLKEESIEEDKKSSDVNEEGQKVLEDDNDSGKGTLEKGIDEK